jgi:hypothetical protein
MPNLRGTSTKEAPVRYAKNLFLLATLRSLPPDAVVSLIGPDSTEVLNTLAAVKKLEEQLAAQGTPLDVLNLLVAMDEPQPLSQTEFMKLHMNSFPVEYQHAPVHANPKRVANPNAPIPERLRRRHGRSF